MPFLPQLAVVFVGILGGGHGKVDQQVTKVVRELKVAPVKVPADKLKAIAHHAAGFREVVQALHADGVVGFEIHDGSLRLVIYDATGQLKTFLDTPVGPRGLDKDDLETLRSTIESDVSSLRHEPAPPAAEEIEMDAPAPAPAPPPPRAPKKAAPPPPDPAPEPAAEPEHAPAPTQTAEATDSVSADEIEALVSGGNTDAPAPAQASPTGGTIGLGASLGVGVTSRSFSTGMPTVPSYASSAVGMVHIDGHIAPTDKLDLGIVAERTLEMSTPLRGGMASTAISRWEAVGSYALVRGTVTLGPEVGLGRRTFSIDSNDPSRAPDGEYNYLIIGAGASASITQHVALRGVALFEPVFSGAEATEMALGEASRWAFDFGLAVEVHRGHMFARAGAEYQQFSWSWDNAGARGGSATDGYPSGTLALGADY